MKYLHIFSVLFLLITSACGGGSNNTGQSFTEFTNQSFVAGEDESSMDINDIKFILDADDNESIFDTLITDGEFTV